MKQIVKKERELKWFSSFLGLIPDFLSFQVITKLLFTFFFVPLYWWLFSLTLKTSDVSNVISNANFWHFLFSLRGFLLGCLTILFVFFLFLLELGGMITLSSQYLCHKYISSYWTIFTFSLFNFKRFIHLGSLFFFSYLCLLFPFFNPYMGLSLFNNLRLPRFIYHTITGNWVYYFSYLALLLLFYSLGFLFSFSFHFILLAKQRPFSAMLHSVRLVVRHKKDFIQSYVLYNVIFMVFLFFFLFLEKFAIRFALNHLESATHIWSKILLFSFFLSHKFLAWVFTLFVLPILLYFLTVKYFTYLEKDPEYFVYKLHMPTLKPQKKKCFLEKLFNYQKSLLISILSILLMISIPVVFILSDMKPLIVGASIEKVGHRGGAGKQFVENTPSAFHYAVKNKADAIELDVQRSRDGRYIVFHDLKLNRLAQDARNVTSLTWEEIETIILKPKEGGGVTSTAHIPLLKDVLKTFKGRLRFYIELKGRTADKQMADDLVALVKELDMEREVVLISLNYRLIEYMETMYPEIDTGFIGFFFLGNIGKLKGDYILMEEDRATEENIEEAHFQGKKVLVWTVNSLEGIQKFVYNSNVDGILTDHLPQLNQVLQKIDEQDAFEQFLIAWANLSGS